MLLKDFISSFSAPETSFYIFDTGNVDHKDIDYQIYNYDEKKAEDLKIRVGDWFVYRIGQRATKDNKFVFFGGGQIASIDPRSPNSKKPEEIKPVQAKIKNPFSFTTPLRQGDPYLENFNWEYKKRPINGWGNNFFSPYGMNDLHENDFLNLFGNLEISTNLAQNSLKEISSESDPISLDSGDFSITIEELNLQPIKKRRSKDKINKKPFKIDYLKKAEANQTLGKAGEEVILSILKEDEEFKDSSITHVADKNDSVGYDIEIEKPSGDKICIEVKTSKGSSPADFYLSEKELSVGRSASDYRIYRLYKFNPVNRSCSLIIYKDPFNSGIFELLPYKYRVKLRSVEENEK